MGCSPPQGSLLLGRREIRKATFPKPRPIQKSQGGGFLTTALLSNRHSGHKPRTTATVGPQFVA